MLKRSLLAVLCLFACVAARAQSLTQTTFVLPVGAADAQVTIASAVGVKAGNFLYVDKEAMQVTAIYTMFSDVAVVNRGSQGTQAVPHTTAATVYAVPSSGFFTTDPTGGCSSNQGNIIVPVSGNIWGCTGGTWTIVFSPTGGGGGGGSGTVSSVTVNSLPSGFTGSFSTGANPALTLAIASQTQAFVLAAPSGSTGVPTWRALIASDIPALAYAPTASPTFSGTITLGSLSGCLAATAGVVSGSGVACGSGTGGATTPATTSLLKGNGSANGVVAATAGTDYLGAAAINLASSGVGGVTGNLPVSQVPGAEQTANKGTANGYAPLNASSVVPLTSLPTIPSTQTSGFPTFPSGAILGTTDTQTVTNKTIDGVTPATMAFLDATSSIQTQLGARVLIGGSYANPAWITALSASILSGYLPSATIITASPTATHLPCFTGTSPLFIDCGVAIDTSQNITGVNNLTVNGTASVAGLQETGGQWLATAQAGAALTAPTTSSNCTFGLVLADLNLENICIGQTGPNVMVTPLAAGTTPALQYVESIASNGTATPGTATFAPTANTIVGRDANNSFASGPLYEAVTNGTNPISANKLVSLGASTNAVNVAVAGGNNCFPAVTEASASANANVYIWYAANSIVQIYADNTTAYNDLVGCPVTSNGNAYDLGTSSAASVPISTIIIGRVVSNSPVSSGSLVSVKLAAPHTYGTQITGVPVDGVSAATMAFVDPTSSVQTQLNAAVTSLSNKAPLGGATFTGAILGPLFKPGHIANNNGTPTLTAGAGLGTITTALTVAAGSDVAMTVSVTTSTAGVAGTVFTITPATTFSTVPNCMVEPANAGAATLASSTKAYYAYGSSGANALVVATQGAIAAGTYYWTVLCVQ